MKVAITGATGHVGGNLVRALLDRGDSVRVLLRGEPVGLDGLVVESVSGDVTDPDTLRGAFDGVEAVFHLAALISITGGQSGRVEAVNVQGVRAVAEAALDAGVRRLVHFSSVHAFDHEPHDEPLDETRRRVGKGHPAYDRSKSAGEAQLQEVVARGLDAVIVNPSGIVGPADPRPSRMGQVFLDLYHRKMPALLDGGFDWVDVRDVVSGALGALEHGRSGEGYLLSGHWHTIRELASLAEEVTGVRAPAATSPMWLAQLGAPFMTLFNRVTGVEPLYTSEALHALKSNRDIRHDKASGELGFEPRPMAETVRDLYAWFEETGQLAGAS